jgi:hypothetical protein
MPSGSPGVELTWVDLPDSVTEPFDVYVNGVLQEPGSDYEQVGRSLLFTRALADEGRLGPWRWLSMFLGVAGSYRKHDMIDVVYESDGQRRVATGLRPTLGDPEGS